MRVDKGQRGKLKAFVEAAPVPIHRCPLLSMVY